MYYWKDISSPKLFGLTVKIKQKYGYEELINFYLSCCEQSFEEMKTDYEYGYGLGYICENNHISQRWLKSIFEFNNVHIRTQEERMKILNSKILPELMVKKYRCKKCFSIRHNKTKN